MPVLSNLHQLLYATVRVEVDCDEGPIEATAFFSSFGLPNGKDAVALVSNRHVLATAKSVRTWFNIEHEGGGPSGEFFECQILLDGQVSLHPNPDVDLAGFIIHHVGERFKETGKKLYYTTIPESLIPDKEGWSDVGIADDVYIAGCPLGIQDNRNHTPIFRKGIIASLQSGSDPREILIDAPTFVGSSGSPVFINSFHSFNSNEGCYEIRDRCYFVGVITSGMVLVQGVDDESESAGLDTHIGVAVASFYLPELHQTIMADSIGR